MGDPYTVLGISPTANSNEIKSAYRRLARLYHPDVNTDPAAGEKFSRIHEAYQTLIDPARRSRFDHEVNQAARGTRGTSGLHREGIGELGEAQRKATEVLDQLRALQSAL